ncbi:MAG: ABC transporter permease [Terriglobia bacterium]|nr:ABC transporter permease [Terriglobia bacterium]
MDFLSILRVAIRALSRNKLRSSLTMLGIIIGVAAVIAMVGIGRGASEVTQQQIAAMGSNLLAVNSGGVNRGGMHTGAGQTKTLVTADMQAILREVPGVAAAAPVNGTSAQVVFEDNNWATQVTGTEPQYFDIRNWPMAEGSSFQNGDVESASNVVVIGQTVKRNLFPDGQNPIGQTMRISNLPFTVVGVLDAKGSSGMGGDQDDAVFVPITTLQKKITGQDWLRSIMVSATSQDMSNVVQDQITALLRDRHRIHSGEENDFNVRNLADLASFADQQSSLMTLLLASIAGVSLIVGGIGIMNIMLVSVTERTREIGIRMAIGAEEKDVQKQFLIEAVVLSLLGGVVGVFSGIGMALLITHTLKWPVSISGVAIAGAMLFSTLVGIFFGYYPAKRAARLDPIEALRFE